MTSAIEGDDRRELAIEGDGWLAIDFMNRFQKRFHEINRLKRKIKSSDLSALEEIVGGQGVWDGRKRSKL